MLVLVLLVLFFKLLEIMSQKSHNFFLNCHFLNIQTNIGDKLMAYLNSCLSAEILINARPRQCTPLLM